MTSVIYQLKGLIKSYLSSNFCLTGPILCTHTDIRSRVYTPTYVFERKLYRDSIQTEIKRVVLRLREICYPAGRYTSSHFSTSLITTDDLAAVARSAFRHFRIYAPTLSLSLLSCENFKRVELDSVEFNTYLFYIQLFL